jgi:hypothetical protein
MPDRCELAGRSRIRAFRAAQQILIVAEGELPSPGYEVDIRQNPIRIFPPHFDLLRCALPGVWPDVIAPFLHAESVRFPEDQSTVTVHHADGEDDVEIEGCGAELAAYAAALGEGTDRPCPAGAEEATGFSKNLSFDEAFANALANLPPIESPVADLLARVQVVEIGGLFGGIAGFNDLFVRVCRTHD